ncbi:hypothetical protein JRQ81_017457 [Phrynocephalus forsythii]|uniref:Uncharacterized protein n=1 Tax=Phrynocephalus forsythii TaxID=171643 RepID=A0A9Q0XRB9_9SAUR|nr:hypothetical protein JRQ81_017457 [Phrynocephalus forsythii]
MNILRLKPELLKIQDAAIQAFNDVSEHTIAWLHEMKLITTILRDKSIKYSWGYPVFIVIYYKDQVYRKEDRDSALNWMREMDILLKKKEWQAVIQKKKGIEATLGSDPDSETDPEDECESSDGKDMKEGELIEQETSKPLKQ